MDDFAAVVAATYADPRGWAANGRLVFRKVATGGDFTIRLSVADRVPGFEPTVCNAIYSCTVGRNVIINESRWRGGPTTFRWPGDLLSYRQMVINHETGHWLGLDHRYCRAAGQPAPIMQQQSKGLQGCTANPWPTAGERTAVTG
jgi:hypothetical protein